MSRKTIIPASVSGDYMYMSTERDVHLFQKKLNIAEKETVSLVSQLARLGFRSTAQALSVSDDGERRVKSPEPVQPFLPKSVDTEVLHKNYQTMVSRLARNESQIQTLRLNICSIKAARDLSSKDQGVAKEQLAQLSEAHAADITRITLDLEKSRRKLKTAEEAVRAAEETNKKLEAALHDSVSTKCDMAVGIEDIHAAKQKLCRRVNELREELTREVSLRSSLEESNTTLLERICQLETMIEAGRQEVEAMNENCLELREEGSRLMEERKKETSSRKRDEDALIKLKTELGVKDRKISDVLGQNKKLAEVVASSKATCSHLRCEVEKQAKLVIDTQTLLVQVQSERETLQERVQLFTTQDTEDETMRQLREELQHVTREKEELFRAKETLLQEVNQAIGSMNEERQDMQDNAKQAQAEIAELHREKDVLEHECTQLRERLSLLDQQQTAHQRVESSLADLLESKNRLAYEKGQLKNRVEQLERSLESLQNVQADADKQRTVNTEIESQLKEAKGEVTEVRQMLHRMKNKYEQERATARLKEDEYAVSIQARSDAGHELQKLKKDLDAVKLREKQKTSSLQGSLNDARSDQSKMAAMLESVMTSHGELQVAVETLQTEIGQKDHELAMMCQEKLHHTRTLDKMHKERTRLEDQLTAVEAADSSQLAALNSELAQAEESQSKMAAQLQDAIAMVTKLQAMIDKLQGELDKKEASYQILAETREHEKEESRFVRQELEDRLEATKQQSRSARELAHKKLYKELSELRQAHTTSSSSAARLQKENQELHKNLEEAEQKMSKLKIRLGSQKTQLDHSRTVQKKNTDLETRLHQIQGQLGEMEKSKEESADKNREQAKTIAVFIEQMAQLQKELELLSDQQIRDADQSRDSHHELDRVTERLTHFQRENMKLRKQLVETEAQKLQLEDKLSEANNESLEISNHLHKAHDWFKSRSHNLQAALADMQEKQARLEQTAATQERELIQERIHSQQQSREAQDMIKASRQALSQLANRAEIDQLEMKTEMRNLAIRVQAERDHATLTDHKMQKILNTSAELIEELALEADQSLFSKQP